MATFKFIIHDGLSLWESQRTIKLRKVSYEENCRSSIDVGCYSNLRKFWNCRYQMSWVLWVDVLNMLHYMKILATKVSKDINRIWKSRLAKIQLQGIKSAKVLRQAVAGFPKQLPEVKWCISRDLITSLVAFDGKLIEWPTKTVLAYSSKPNNFLTEESDELFVSIDGSSIIISFSLAPGPATSESREKTNSFGEDSWVTEILLWWFVRSESGKIQEH